MDNDRWHTSGQLIQDSDGGTVCTIPRANGRRDAKLIASAPDLLAALKDLVEECDVIGMNRGMAGQRVNAARAAIAKAQPKVSA